MVQNEVFLDVNVLMDLFFERDHMMQVQLSLEKLKVGLVLYVSIVSVATFFYYVEKEKRNKNDAFEFLESYVIVDMNLDDYEWARANDLGDFEDALQVACALRHGCRKFMTLDLDLIKRHNRHIEMVKI